jgi:hypothetical protein
VFEYRVADEKKEKRKVEVLIRKMIVELSLKIRPSELKKPVSIKRKERWFIKSYRCSWPVAPPIPYLTNRATPVETVSTLSTLLSSSATPQV